MHPVSIFSQHQRHLLAPNKKIRYDKRINDKNTNLNRTTTNTNPRTEIRYDKRTNDENLRRTTTNTNPRIKKSVITKE